MKCLYTGLALLLLINLTACGGGGGGDSTPDNTPPPPPALEPIQNGVFKDSNVSGVFFTSGQEIGVTDTNGRFTCETGVDVTFSIGNVVFGQTECTTLVMPPSLVASGNVDDLQVVNIARFLQMLDEDGSDIDGLPMDGINISSGVQMLADSWSVDFTTADLDTELMTILSEVASADSRTARLPGEDDAQEHLEASLACAYAGAFVGSFSGSNSGAMEMKVGWGNFGSFERRGAEWFGWDASEDTGFFGGGSRVVDLKARPTIDSDPTAAGPINAQYITPDRITGAWEGGTFDLSRLGGDVGKYRLIGKFSGGVNDGLASGGVIVIHLDGNSVIGEAFETTEGIFFQVTGSVLGDDVSLTATGGGETINAIATIARDMAGEPTAATGVWPEGNLELVACRLN